MENTKFYQKTWFIVLMLILFFPVGLILMWKFANWKKSAKIIVTAVFVILTIVSLLTPDDESSTSKGNEADTTAQTTVVETTKAVDKEVQLLMDKAKLTEEEAKIILKDLKTVGAGKIGYCKLITDGPDKGFEVEDNDYKFVVTTKDGKTDTIYCGSILLFNYEGGALTSIKNFHLDSSEKIQFKVSAKMWVEEALKAPSTAKYNEELRVTRKNDVVTVQSSVDSQNSFGAMIRSNFTVQMSYKSEGSELIYLEIDGEALYGKPVKVN